MRLGSEMVPKRPKEIKKRGPGENCRADAKKTTVIHRHYSHCELYVSESGVEKQTA
jgi:hypothetical protein